MRKVLLILAIAGIALVALDNTAEATWRHRAAYGCCAPACDPCCDPCDSCSDPCDSCSSCDSYGTSCCGTSVGYGGYYGGWGYTRAAYRPSRLYYVSTYGRYGGCCY